MAPPKEREKRGNTDQPLDCGSDPGIGSKRKTEGQEMNLSDVYINMDEARRLSGFSSRSIRDYIKRGEFAASLPRGRCGGWHIVRESFLDWWGYRNASTANRTTVPTRKRRAA
jgi:hypothetical protein